MNYTLELSLEDLAAIKLATMLWDPNKVADIMSELSIEYYHILKFELDWLKIENRIKQQVPELPLAEVSKEKILGFIKPVGLQIFKWILLNIQSNLFKKLPLEFCWTSHGILDRKRTAELLVEKESIDITVRYKISCNYCLENSIEKLWAKMSRNCRKAMYEDMKGLVRIWTCIITGKLCRIENKIERPHISSMLGKELNYICSPYQYAFEYAADKGNFVAADYFYDKMTPSERKESLVPVAGSVAYKRMVCDDDSSEFQQEDYSHVLFFLLSNMNYEQQIELLGKAPCLVLKCLLDWPWQICFLKAASIIWDFISPGEYTLVAMALLCKIADDHECFNYNEIFREFWQHGKNDHKRFFFTENSMIVSNVPALCIKKKIFVKLFKTNNESIIKLVFLDATLEEKKRIMYSDVIGQNICIFLINNERWALLDYFIRQCVSSKNEMLNYRTRFMAWAKLKYVKKEDIHRICLKLLDDIVYDFDKRKSDNENDVNKAKRPCIS